ncbi:MAG: BrnT family toxin [Rudaea sp.]
MRSETFEFEWNVEKARQNELRHGITFEEAETAFDDAHARVGYDPDHSLSEHRLILIGHSDRNRLLFISFTERHGRIRIISARKATRNERKRYEERQE